MVGSEVGQKRQCFIGGARWEASLHERCFDAPSIKPFERSCPWLRRTRALWGLNKWEIRCGGGLDLCDRAQPMTWEEERS
jgi:hypothetical protein